MRSKAIFMALLAFTFGAQAVPVSVEQARSAAQSWVRGGRQGMRLGARIGTLVGQVSERRIGGGHPFYEVRLRDGATARGTLIMSADTEREPIIAFSPESVDISTLDRRSPLYALLSADARFGLNQRNGVRERARAARRWARLRAAGERVAADGLDTAAPIHSDSDTVIEDLRVGKLLTTKWGQSDMAIEGGGFQDPCFNYYTPSNYVCGCVATATAQIMRFNKWPTNEVAVFTETCVCDGKDIELTTLGGAFDWTNMVETVLSMSSETRELQCQAIGRLTYECGVAVRMDYAEDGSGAVTRDVSAALKKRFGYANAEWFGDTAGLTNDEKVRAEHIYPSLDAGYPVLFSIRGGLGGHAVVCDGYGYNTVDGEPVPYVHINMGWTSQNDWWYNLPEINVGDNPESFQGFDELSGVGYNIFPDKTGRIVSGRVLDVDGNPVAGLPVKLGDLEATTSEHGVFAFILSTKDFPRGNYTLSAVSEDGKYVGSYDVTLSNDNRQNYWGCDIELGFPSVRVGTEIYSTLNHALAAVAEGAGDVVEILLPTELRRDVTIVSNCTIIATNPVASASPVTCKAGVSLAVAGDARVLFENVAFENADGSDVAVSVASNGIAAVSGFVGVHTFKTAFTNGLELAGELKTPLFIDCPSCKSAGAVFGFVTAEVPEACLALIRNPYDEDLGGKLSGSNLVWADVAVPHEAAIVRLLQDDTEANYLSLGKLLRFVTNDAEIVICKGCPFTNAVPVTKKITITSEGGSFTIRSTSPANFRIAADGALTVSNVTFAGDAASVNFSTPNFITVGPNGALTLENGACLRGFEYKGESLGGTILLDGGEVTMLPGSEIRACRAVGRENEGQHGGAIYAKSGELNLLGGTITECFATMQGGGVYTRIPVRVGGALQVFGNTSGKENPVADDLYVDGKDNRIEVVSGMNGARVMTKHSPVMSFNGPVPSPDDKGEVFAHVTEALSPDELASLNGAFINDLEPALQSQVQVDGSSVNLIWAQNAADPRICPEEDAENAYARVIWPDGTTTLWYQAADALEEATDGCVVELLKDAAFERSLTLQSGAVTLRTPTGSEPLVLSRAVDCGITVSSSAALTLTNVIVSGVVDFENDDASVVALFNVEGGCLCLNEGSAICYVDGDGNRAADAVVVWKRGKAVLNGGEIHDCVNWYEDEEPGVESGCGAAILLEGEDSVLELKSGAIYFCASARGGAVSATDKSTVCISGEVKIFDNWLLDDVYDMLLDDLTPSLDDLTPSNLVVSDLSSLILVDELADGSKIGYTEGVEGNTNVFGTVDADYYARAMADDAGYAALTNGATSFRHDLTKARGVVATNGTENVLLVWSTAFVKEGDVWKFTDEDGNTYGAVGEIPSDDPGPVPPPPGPTPGPEYEVKTNEATKIAFSEIKRLDETTWRVVVTDRVENCKYRLLCTDDLTRGFTATEIDWQTAEADGPWTNELTKSSAAWFWRAEGADTITTNYFSNAQQGE